MPTGEKILTVYIHHASLRGMKTKDAVLVLRIPASDKSFLAAAAAHAGMSLSTLVLKATLKEASGILEKAERGSSPDPRDFSKRQAMTYLRTLAKEARRGGCSRHLKVGFAAARFTPKLLATRASRAESLSELRDFVRSADTAAIILWYKKHLPAVAQLPPHWRHDEFAEGVRSAWASGDAMLRP